MSRADDLSPKFNVNHAGSQYSSIPLENRTWSMGRKLALHIILIAHLISKSAETFHISLHIILYHSICSKYKCYTAKVCNKRNPSLVTIEKQNVII